MPQRRLNFCPTWRKIDSGATSDSLIATRLIANPAPGHQRDQSDRHPQPARPAENLIPVLIEPRIVRFERKSAALAALLQKAARSDARRTLWAAMLGDQADSVLSFILRAVREPAPVGQLLKRYILFAGTAVAGQSSSHSPRNADTAPCPAPQSSAWPTAPCQTTTQRHRTDDNRENRQEHQN